MLVAFAPEGGAAQGVAEAVGRTLRAAGLHADVRAADEVTQVGRYLAVVLGGDSENSAWRPEAAELLESFQETLAAKPLWLFAGVRTAPSAPFSADLATLIEATGPLGIGTFWGVTPDEPAVAAWALTIAAHLGAEPGGPEGNRTRAEGSIKVSHPRFFTEADARRIGEALHVTWDRFDVEQFRMGLDVELEHGRRDPATDVTHDSGVLTGKIALAHLNEFPDYYTRLAKMEAEAEAYWQAQSVHG